MVTAADENIALDKCVESFGRFRIALRGFFPPNWLSKARLLKGGIDIQAITEIDWKQRESQVCYTLCVAASDRKGRGGQHECYRHEHLQG
jgi:hypothetical protein